MSDERAAGAPVQDGQCRFSNSLAPKDTVTWIETDTVTGATRTVEVPRALSECIERSVGRRTPNN